MSTSTTRLSLAVLISGACFVHEASGQPDEVIRATENAWKARESRIQSIRLEWEETVTTKKGGITAEHGFKGKQDQVLPEVDRTHKGTCALVMDGNKMRCEVRSKVFMRDKEDWVDWTHDAVFDGSVGLSSEDQPTLPVKSARRTASEVPFWFRTPGCFAPIQFARPVVNDLNSVRLADYRFSGRKTKIRDSDCVELVLVKPSEFGSSTVWVDPGKDYVIVRRLQIGTRKGELTSAHQDDIRYREHSPGTWVPMEWSVTRQKGNTGTFCVIEARLSRADFEIHPAPILFDTTPPRKSVFTDTKADGTWTESVVHEDGSQVEITPTNRSVAIRELTGELPRSRAGWTSRNRYLLILVAALGLLCVIVVARRYYFTNAR